MATNTKKYRLVRGNHALTAQRGTGVTMCHPGDIVDLTETQAKAFADKFEPVDAQASRRRAYDKAHALRQKQGATALAEETARSEEISDAAVAQQEEQVEALTGPDVKIGELSAFLANQSDIDKIDDWYQTDERTSSEAIYEARMLELDPKVFDDPGEGDEGGDE